MTRFSNSKSIRYKFGLVNVHDTIRKLVIRNSKSWWLPNGLSVLKLLALIILSRFVDWMNYEQRIENSVQFVTIQIYIYIMDIDTNNDSVQSIKITKKKNENHAKLVFIIQKNAIK